MALTFTGTTDKIDGFISYDAMLNFLAYSLPVAMAGMAALYWLQRRRGDAGVVDVGWAGGIGLVAVAAAYSGDGWEPRRLLLGLMGAAWSFRLTAYLVIDRLVRAKEEDGRYQMLRAQWGAKAQRYFFYLFEAQALLVVLFGLPFVAVAAKAQVGWTAWDVAGALVWTVAVVGEWIADRQLAAFRSQAANQGRTCDRGLWRYSRHPNYFFEWIHWWAYAVMAVGSAIGWLAWIGPVLMLFLLYRVTGIPYTEKRALVSRGEDYRRYQHTTSPFIPWVPRRENVERD